MPEMGISQGDAIFTVLVDIHLAPGAQAQFVARLGEMIVAFNQHQPGFVASAIHQSEDGTRVLNYLQWRDRESYQRFIAHPEAANHIADLEKIAQSITAHIMPPVAIYLAARPR